MNKYFDIICKKLTTILVCFLVFTGCQSRINLVESIKTKYPVKDWVIADYVVTDSKFGAKPIKGFDNRKAFQAAIDAAYEAGGGVVYIPAGHYEFRSAQKGVKPVRIRKGEQEKIQNYEYEYVLKLHPGVQLRGDWADPSTNGGKVEGTVLNVLVGHNSPNYDKKVSSWWNDPQCGNVLRTSYTSVADRFIEMNPGTGVTNLSIWYPEQKLEEIVPYPWTLFQNAGDNVTIERVSLVNAYNGFYSSPSELHYVVDSYMTALNKGMEIHVCTDIGRVENVKISPSCWAKSGLPGAPKISDVMSYTQKNAIGFKMHRSDWEYISYLQIEGYETGLWIGKEPGFDNAPNAQLYGIDIKNCHNGLYVEDVNPYGILVSNSSIEVNEKDDYSVYFHPDFDTSVQFNGVNFKGTVYSEGTGGVISFESCCFNNKQNAAMKIDNGNVLCTQCQFKKVDKHILLGQDCKSFSAVNSGVDKTLFIQALNKHTNVQVDFDERYKFTPIPKNLRTNAEFYPRPQSNKIFHAKFEKVTGYNNNVPTHDISQELQDVLDKIGNEGGGTLYLPAGRYLVESPIIIPQGVELRGSWDVPHHTMSGGTAIMTNYDGGKLGEQGASLIQLEKNSGIKGITIVQLNIISDKYNMEHPRKTPFLIQGKGTDVYIVNVTIPLGDKGIDLATYNTSRHYVQYLGGTLLRAGIWVGGGAQDGTIRNMQLNPHYGSRLPRGGQGYPKASAVKYVQSNCSALKFGDVKNETIFNNFVFGSVYGIHFLKDPITGKNPGKIQMIGHGSDGCTFALYVENADSNTKITAINSELVNTHIKHEPVRSYVKVGGVDSIDTISSKAKLTLYNSAFWGSPVVGAIINNGNVIFNQTNFQSTGSPAIEVRNGKVDIYTSFFSKMNNPKDKYIQICQPNIQVGLVNNFYTSEFTGPEIK